MRPQLYPTAGEQAICAECGRVGVVEQGGRVPVVKWGPSYLRQDEMPSFPAWVMFCDNCVVVESLP